LSFADWGAGDVIGFAGAAYVDIDGGCWFAGWGASCYTGECGGGGF
jgi:hypothetical protein